MPSDIDRGLAEDEFGKIEAKLALIRTTATAPPAAPESWFKRTFAPAAPSSRQSGIDIAVVDALQETVTLLRARFAQLDQEVAGLRSVMASVREFHERSAATETMLAQLRQEQSEVRDRLAAIGEQMAHSGQEQSEKSKLLAAGPGNLANELRERIQQVLDEQRVSLRQISLKTSEEAVLADRARRATELRLDELARRVPEKPA